jgi:peptide/nickel transport system substrate-binding protein
VVLRTADFDAFNEFVTLNAETRAVCISMLFMPLVGFDADGTVQPYLAESWELAPDALSVTYHLREDVTWHDDVPTTAEDVKFTYERARDPAVAYPRPSTFADYDRAEVLDPYTIRFIFKWVVAEQVENLATLPIMPKHLLEKLRPAELRNASFNHQPVGNGPFRFVRWKANQEIVFEANKAFSPSLSGPPYLDRVVFRIVPDQTTALTMLLSGQADVVDRLLPADAEQVAASGIARLLTYPAWSTSRIVWNSRLPLFDTREERTALTLAINRQALVEGLLHGHGRVAATDPLETWWGRDTSLAPLPYDPVRAKALLAQAGWRDSDGDGVLDQDGRRFDFELVTSTGSALARDLTVVIAADLAKIGVVARPTQREFTGKQLRRKDFQAALGGWAPGFTYDPRSTFSSKYVDSGRNYGSFTNVEADSLMELGTSLMRREDAKPVWAAFQRLLAREQPYTWLYWLDALVGVSRRVRFTQPDFRGWMADVRHWWIAE